MIAMMFDGIELSVDIWVTTKGQGMITMELSKLEVIIRKHARGKMRRSASGIEEYDSCSMAQRVSFLCENYTVMEAMIRNYRERLIAEVMEQKACNRHAGDEGLGVRIQVAFGRKTDPTANNAMNRMVIAKAIDEGYLDDDFFEGTEDREGLIRKVTAYHMANASFRYFSEKLEEMNPKDRKILIPYLLKEKTIEMIAEDLKIEYRSVIQRITRFKRKMRDDMDASMN